MSIVTNMKCRSAQMYFASLEIILNLCLINFNLHGKCISILCHFSKKKICQDKLLRKI